MNRKDVPTLPKISLYSFENFLNVYTDSNTDYNFYNLQRAINVVPTNNESAEDDYVVSYSDTWGSISYKQYNTLDLWWLICNYNQIENPTKMPVPGTVLKLLKSKYVGTVLSELQKQISR
jgi:hypothetical protein